MIPCSVDTSSMFEKCTELLVDIVNCIFSELYFYQPQHNQVLCTEVPSDWAKVPSGYVEVPSDSLTKLLMMSHVFRMH